MLVEKVGGGLIVHGHWNDSTRQTPSPPLMSADLLVKMRQGARIRLLAISANHRA